MLYLVRHAKAGSRHDWDGDDRARPLSRAGRRQADAIAARLADRLDTTPATLLSSSYVRCRQTLAPLAARLAATIADEACLEEGSRFEDTVALLGEVPDGAVLCSHGDVIPEVIEALHRRGCRVRGEADWRKATVWLLDRRDGEFVDARVWPPPTI
jgi:8-oxo-dGTP diphosphatase